MKKLNWSLLFVLCFVLLVPASLLAQGTSDPPPACCPRGPEGTGQNPNGSPIARGQILITTGMLQAQGITRREFVERLSVSIFAGRQVDLVWSLRSTTNSQIKPVNLISGAALSGLVAVQETRYYRVPLFSLETEQLESLDQFDLTDGTVQFTVKFIRSTSPDADAF